MFVPLHEVAELRAHLSRLFQEELAARHDAYVASHASAHDIAHRIDVFRWYVQRLPDTGVFLDWGCWHGLDSCMLRWTAGEHIELHACDFPPPEAFRVFRACARPQYRQLTEVGRLPYPDAMFDVVIGSGVLEHVALEGESLRELYRVLKPDGLLVVTYLPYAWSWNEWRLRRQRSPGFHRRLYTRGETVRTLLKWGFYPLELEFHTFVAPFNPPLVRLKEWARWLMYPPFRHDALCCVARKMSVM
jgi:SAM-dependent methyltransferase